MTAHHPTETTVLTDISDISDMIETTDPMIRNWGHTIALCALATGCVLAASIAFPHAASAAGFQVPDPTAWAQQALDFLKKLWVFVFIAEILALLTYLVAFFTQSWFPSFFQSFQGDWVKKAVIIGVAAPVVMGALIAAATGAMGGFK